MTASGKIYEGIFTLLFAMLRFSELSHLPVFCKYFRVLQRRYFFSLTLADYEAVVKLSDGFNGADLRNVCTEAGLCGIIPIALKFSPTSIVSSKTVLHLKK